ncbi:MAG: hypothetical protein A2113_02180 [Candidatus Woykebacteria bacterium GWA1_44_8]|uniref:Uncharacterized protein n=1 Tax=Candidatus Woykebacteria bacterium GWA1_44_8 TaxID=1802591 RepID=A0A1G1W4R4_9BACT|nr:MAG: hypothetical protein A2113_02180 [Candidatus Woykebacteria bacterium GWA1_44_8]
MLPIKLPKNKPLLIALVITAAIVLIALSWGVYYLGVHQKTETAPTATKSAAKEKNQPKSTEQPQTFPYTLVAYKGAVFGAKVPQGWQITDNESGIDIMDPTDSNTGAAGAVAVGWYGYQTPDGFISFMVQAVGGTNMQVINESSEESIQDPNNTGLVWRMKTKTFTFQKAGQTLKAKASAGVLNGYGQFMGMVIAFQTTPDKWGKWAPTLERVAQSITIINPSKAGGMDKVRLPTAADLANDSSPLMDSWNYRNKVQEKTSHEFSDAIMGQESDLRSPSTGQSYTLPLTSYDPTAGGYRNPSKPNEILVDPY